jgi:hypothetical protein
MSSNISIRVRASMACIALSCALLVAAPLVNAQAPSHFLGTINAIGGSTLTVKTDAGDLRQVEVPATAAIKRIAPGQRDLSAAETIQFSDLSTGDRVLVKLDPEAPGPTGEALQIIAIKQSDLAQKREKDLQDWKLRGVGGVVKSVDAAAGVIVLSSGSGTTAKIITLHTTKATKLKRYAPASARIEAALPAPIDAVHTGDQLQARGTKNADGTEITAEEVVSGSFRNISGTIASLDAASSIIVVKDLITKKPVAIHITAETQMRRLPDMMAHMLAARLKGATGNASGLSASAPPQNAAAEGSQRGGNGHWAGNHSGAGADPQQMLSRAPSIQLADLTKGEAVMLVSSEGTGEVTAITLLAGVEPLLEAPAASQDLLSSWSMNSSAPEAAQ